MNQLLAPQSPPAISLRANAYNFHYRTSVLKPITGRRKLRIRTRRSAFQLSVKLDDSQEQQLNLSVLRFTFGLSWLDESYLPRWIGYGFGSLIVLNHFLTSTSSVTSPQLVSEALGLSLAAFSATLPYLGKFLKGATPVDQRSLPEGTQQIFVMSQNISDTLKEDLAWATYILLRNTSSISVLISIQDALCVRGYWTAPDDLSRDGLLDWFKKQMKMFNLCDMEDALYFPQTADAGFRDPFPRGTGSLLIQPVPQLLRPMVNEEQTSGFVVLASSIDYAYSDKDRSWIRAIANKFGGTITPLWMMRPEVK